MSAAPDTAIQVNFKVGGQYGDLINVYATDGVQLQQLLSELGEAAEAIGQARTLLNAVGALAPLNPVAAPQAAQAQIPQQYAPATPTQPAEGLPEPAEAEYCQHGKMTWKTGKSSKGNIYGVWECSAKDPADPSRWPKRGR
jgi:hypothetical protein